MNCEKCGNRIDSNTAFCNQCGNATDESNADPHVPLTATPFQSASGVKSSKPSTDKKTSVNIYLLVALPVILGILFFTYSKVRMNAELSAIEKTVQSFSYSMSVLDFNEAYNYSVNKGVVKSLISLLAEAPYNGLTVDFTDVIGNEADFNFDISFSKEDITVDGDKASVPAQIKMWADMSALPEFPFATDGKFTFLDEPCVLNMLKQHGTWYILSVY